MLIGYARRHVTPDNRLLRHLARRWLYTQEAPATEDGPRDAHVFLQCGGGQAHKVHETTTFLLVTSQNIHLVLFKKIIGSLGNKPFLIWLLTPATP